MITRTIEGIRPSEVAYENADNADYVGNPAIELGLNMAGHATVAASRYSALLRFDNLPVPKGATVTNAVLRVTPLTTSVDDADVDMFCEDIAFSPTLETLASIFTERSGRQTTGTATWASDGLGAVEVTSDSFHAALLELLRRGDLTINLGQPTSVGIIFAGGASTKVLHVNPFEIFLDVTYNLFAAQSGLSTANVAEGIAFALDKRVSELTVRCDTGSSKPLEFKVPGVNDDWYELAAGTSLSLFSPPRDTGGRSIDHVIFRSAAVGTTTFSYVTSGV